MWRCPIKYLAVVILTTMLCGSCISKKEILVDGVTRTYHLHLPKGYDATKEHPVLFLFHGSPSNGWQMNIYTKMNKTADKYGFILVYPNAKDKRWTYDDADIAYVKKLIQQLRENYAVDPTRLYFAGMSAGGIFCHLLAQNIPDQMAAMAVVSGNMFNPNLLENPIKPQIPMVVFHGTDDFMYKGIKNDQGEYEILPTENTLKYYLGDHKQEPIKSELPNSYERDHSTVIKIDYRKEKPIVFYKIIHGGHHWPDARFDARRFTKAKLGNFNRDINTNEALWNFVSAYRKNK